MWNERRRASVREEMDGNVLILTIDYPSRKNAIGPGVRQALEEAIERAHDDKAVRAIVITGAGGHLLRRRRHLRT